MKIPVKSEFEFNLDYLIERSLTLQKALKDSEVYLGSDFRLHKTSDYLVDPKIKIQYDSRTSTEG